jgi:hypothetical protein
MSNADFSIEDRVQGGGRSAERGAPDGPPLVGYTIYVAMDFTTKDRTKVDGEEYKSELAVQVFD